MTTRAKSKNVDLELFLNFMRKKYHDNALEEYGGYGIGSDLWKKWKNIQIPFSVRKSVNEARRDFNDYKQALQDNKKNDVIYFAESLARKKVPREIYDTDVFDDIVSAGVPDEKIFSFGLGDFTFPDLSKTDDNNIIDIIELDKDEPPDVTDVGIQPSKKRRRDTKFGRNYISVYNTQPAFEGPSFDTQYCDFAIFNDVPEFGVVERSIISSPKDYFNGRDSNTIRVYRIEVKGEFKLEFGGNASPRFILFLDRQPLGLDNNIITGWKNAVKVRPVEDIISKDPLNLRERLLITVEGDIPNIEGNPNNLTFPAFTNTKSQMSDAIVHLYELYKDLDTKAVKGVAGEDFDSVPLKETFKFKVDTDIIVRFANDDPQSIIMNNISILYIGDYDGGLVTGVFYTRCYYHPVLE